jgi:peptidoglycan/LPS O-acetylase OafA/YrhL
MKHLKSLTSLRFFAAFVVVLCHLRYTHEKQLPLWAWNFAKNGFVGVNLFFVLSGFVIAYNYGERFLEKTTTFKKFMVARFARIWPAFVAALVLAVPVYVIGNERAMAKLPLLIPTHLLLIHNWFPNLGSVWLSPSWTIGTEWGFYLMFPLFAAAVFRLKERGLWTLLIVSLLLGCVAPALYHAGVFTPQHRNVLGDVAGEDLWGRILRWYSFFRLPEFLVGVCVCRLFMLQDTGQREKWGRALGPVAALSVVAIIGLMASDVLPMMFINQAALTLPFAVLIWYLAYDRGWIARVMAVPTLVLLGEASYSLYLVHIIVKQVMYHVSGALFNTQNGNVPLTISVIIGSILFSIFMFKCIERPSRRWIVDRFGGKSKVRGVVAPPEEKTETPTPVAS